MISHASNGEVSHITKNYTDYKIVGLMIDPARHYIKVETMKRVIDAMEWNKFNVLHIHFTVASSFPLIIDDYPLLSEKVGRKKKSF